jgi:hypothetical protein
MRLTTAAIVTGLGLGVLAGCSRVETPLSAAQIEQQYGLTGARTDIQATSAGQLQGTLVPITLADGRAAHIFIPLQQSKDVEAVYLRDEQGLHPVRLETNARREDMARAPAIATTRPARAVAKPRSWEREVLIVAGSTGAGAAIGGLAAGKKGAKVGAAAGGAGGLIYDLLTRRRK